MMPEDLERVQYYNRHNHDEYVYWLLDRCNEGLAPYGEKITLQTLMLLCGSRESVDEMVTTRLNNLDLEKPMLPIVEGEIIEDFKPENTVWSYTNPEDNPSWVDAVEETVDGVEFVQDREGEIEEHGEQEIEEETVEETVVQDSEETVIVPTVDNPFGDVDYHSWTIRELQEECRERGITIRGTKSEVVLRLRQHDEGILTQETEDETEAPSEEAAEDLSDAPVDDTAATEEVTENDHSGQQGENSSEEE